MQITEDKLGIGKSAKYLGVSVDTLRRWEMSGKIDTHRSPGGHRYFSKQDLDKLFGNKYVHAISDKTINSSENIVSSNNEQNIKKESSKTSILSDNVTTNFNPSGVTNSPIVDMGHTTSTTTSNIPLTQNNISTNKTISINAAETFTENSQNNHLENTNTNNRKSISATKKYFGVPLPFIISLVIFIVIDILLLIIVYISIE
ncbi:helix-turn-helix domain-containing protein [Candidatus Woesebacteria bacterium]|nr:MAG: helix-turn-helix domain-containing protein [Candidatus Woesebacteria bacterium]